MPAIREVLRNTIAAARGGDWTGYRARLAALREALERTGASQEEPVCRHLDTLAAAAPEYDAAGCAAELEALEAALGTTALDASASSALPPVLDLRGLQPPEPMVRIFDALQRAPGEPLRVILPHEPLPLYDLLRQRGFRHSGATRPDGGYELFIEPS